MSYQTLRRAGSLILRTQPKRFTYPGLDLGWYLEQLNIIRRTSGVLEYDLHVDVVDEATMQEMNREDRGKDKPTDVLSYPSYSREDVEDFGWDPELATRPGDFLPPLMPESDGDGGWDNAELGQLVLCPAYIERDALAHGVSFRHNLLFVSVHGVCHLLGYDHEDPADEVVMKAREREIFAGVLREMGLPEGDVVP